MKTRQAILVQPGRFELRDTNLSPSHGQILIRVAACGLCNWELNHFAGKLGKCPQSLGHEIAGFVEEIGLGVTRFRPGDAVTGLPPQLGGFADYAIFDEKDSVKLSPQADVAACMGEPLSCVITTLVCAEPQAGDVGVIIGCGPMGLWCTQLLAGNTLTALVAVDVDDRRLSLAREFGATHTINTSTTDGPAELARLTDNHMADFVIEGSGNPKVFATAAAYLRDRRGRLILMSSHEEVGPPFDWRPLLSKGASIRTTHPTAAIDQTENLRRAVQLYNRGVLKVRPLLTHTFSLTQIQTAFETLEHKPKGYLKGIVTPHETSKP